MNEIQGGEGWTGTGLCQLSHPASLSTSLVGKQRVEAVIRRTGPVGVGVQGLIVKGWSP